MKPSSKSQRSPKRSKVDLHRRYEERHYEHIPLEFFSAKTKKLKAFDRVIDRAAELTGCNRRATYDSITHEMRDPPWYYRSSEDIRYYIARAECDLQLRAEMPWFSPGDNEYG